MKIPRTIHQTWKDSDIPGNFRRLASTWITHHADWEYRIWTDDMNRSFISSNFPEFLEKYDAYPSNIYRVDAVRYLVLYVYGGIFVDLDFECLRNMEPLLQNARCVFGKEPVEHCKIHKKDMVISNAFMAAVPGHPFLKALYNELVNFSPETDHPNDRVLETTGPFMLTRVYNAFDNKEAVSLLSSDHIYPLTKSELSIMFNEGKDSPALTGKINNAHALHYYYGTWWDSDWNTRW